MAMYKKLECRRNGTDLTFESRRNGSRRNGSRRNGSRRNGNTPLVGGELSQSLEARLLVSVLRWVGATGVLYCILFYS